MQAQPPRVIAIGLIAAAAAALLGCASTQVTGPANRGAGSQKTAALPGKPGCFWLRQFQGSWTVLNSSELIVYVPLDSEPYLIKLFEPVQDLKFDERLGFVDAEHSGMICDGSTDYLAVPHWQPHRIPILAVRKLTQPEERQLLAQNHIKPPFSKPAKGNRTATQ
ncbi:MAG: DUF6491 family protein [Steroidobacteraceae bacterium]